MRVAMWYNNRDVRVEEMPVPEIGPDEALLRVESSGICGSDGLEWYRLHRAPLVLGHEVAGTVVDAGKNVTRVSVGDRVSVAHHVPCNTCHYCLSGHESCCPTLQSTNFFPGGFTEFLRIPAINIDRGTFMLPDHVTFDDATFVEPLACVMRGLEAARIQPGNSVFVIGCGISAQLMIMAARALGAGKIIALDNIPFRREMALKNGADAVLDSEEYAVEQLKDLNGGLGADRVIINRPLMEIALKSVEKGGVVLFFAGAEDPEEKINIPWNDIFWRTEVTLTSSYAGPPRDSHRALSLIASDRIPVHQIITHRLPLAGLGEGIEMLTHPWKYESMKIVIHCQE